MGRQRAFLKVKVPIAFLYEFEAQAIEADMALNDAVIEACTQWWIVKKDRLSTKTIEEGGQALKKLENERLERYLSITERLRDVSPQE